jgi:hypothetical protein
MSERLSFTEPSRIPEVVEIIHDAWFDADQIRFDRTKEELVIPFRCRSRERKKGNSVWSFQRGTARIVQCYLRIHHVQAYQIVDENRVGLYDFDELRYDAKSGRVVITTGVPIRLEIIVQSFGLTVEITEQPVSGTK